MCKVNLLDFISQLTFPILHTKHMTSVKQNDCLGGFYDRNQTKIIYNKKFVVAR